MWKEFKEFAIKGNMIDLAVGIIVGGAFSKIITSLVNDIMSPILGLLIGKVDVSNIVLSVFGANIKIGLFLQNLIDFIIVSFAVFLIVKTINNLRREKAEEIVEEKLSREEKLLEDIRNILADRYLSLFALP